MPSSFLFLTPTIKASRGWLFDLQAFPKRDVIFDVLSGIFRVRVIPCRVFVHFSVDDDVVITRRTLPTADSVGVARLKVFFVDRVRREIVIAFDSSWGFAYCDYCAVPNR